MHASLKIMDIDVDMISTDILIEKMNEFMSDDSFNVILYASTQLLDLATEDEELRGEIHSADMLLPGEEPLLTLHHVNVLQAGDMVVSCRSFGTVLENLQKENRTSYIISRSQERADLLKEFCQSMQPELHIVGECFFEEGTDEMAVINEINAHTPDMLILDIEPEAEIQWIMDKRLKLNAKLCIAIGGVSDLILNEYKKVPPFIKKMKLQKVYDFLVKDMKLEKINKERIFKKKVANYNNKKAEEQDE